MRNYLLGAVALGALVATPAMARDGQAYAGIEGGVVFPDDIEYEIDGVDSFAEVDHDLGFDIGGVVGYDFGIFRLEGEGAWKKADVDTVLNTSTTGTGAFDGEGDLQIFSAMVNGLLDFGSDSGVNFYIGGGAGYAEVQTEYNTLGTGGDFIVNQDYDEFAYQGIAGLRFPVSDRVDLGVKYRYFRIDDINTVAADGSDVNFDVATHSVLASLLVNLGGSAPTPVVAPPIPPRPVAPPPPPPPPPPVQTIQCETGPYIVFFDWDKSDVTPEAAQTLNQAVAAYGNCGTARIMLAGYTDTSGSRQYNQGLAARRNASVREYMTARSVPSARITSEAFGEENLRVPTADGVRELQNRRVEIMYGPNSGM